MTDPHPSMPRMSRASAWTCIKCEQGNLHSIVYTERCPLSPKPFAWEAVQIVLANVPCCERSVAPCFAIHQNTCRNYNLRPKNRGLREGQAKPGRFASHFTRIFQFTPAPDLSMIFSEEPVPTFSDHAVVTNRYVRPRSTSTSLRAFMMEHLAFVLLHRQFPHPIPRI
jgi:hypothetical protein